MAKPLCLCIKGPNPVEPHHKVPRTGKLAVIQTSPQLLGHFCANTETRSHLPAPAEVAHLVEEQPAPAETPSSGTGSQAKSPCYFLPFPTTLVITTDVTHKKQVVTMALSNSLLSRRIKYYEDLNPAQLLWLFGSKIQNNPHTFILIMHKCYFLVPRSYFFFQTISQIPKKLA